MNTMQNSPASEDPVQQLVAQQAADWYVANREGLDRESAAEFAGWLKASPLHVQEYLCLAQVAGDLRTAAGNPVTSIDSLVEGARNAPDEVAAVVELPVARPALGRLPPAHGAHAPGAASWMRMAAAVAGVSLLGVLALWRLAPGIEAVHHETAHGQHLSHSLPDQSLLTLDADSAVDVHYGSALRRIELVRGQALFQVTHDASRPFVVQAGPVAVTAVGTRFDVDRRADATVVTVLEGTVAVDIAPAPGAAPGTAAARHSVKAGQQLRVDGDGVATGPVAVDAARSAAWLDGQIYFDQEPLAEVAAEVSRYSPQPIEVRDERLRSLAISGACATGDTDSFLAFVRSLEGVRVHGTAGSVVVEPAR